MRKDVEAHVHRRDDGGGARHVLDDGDLADADGGLDRHADRAEGEAGGD